MKTFYKLSLFAILLLFSQNILAQANAGPDKDICYLDTLKLYGQGLNAGDTGSYRWRDIGSGSVYSNAAELKLKITSMLVRSFELRLIKNVNGNPVTTYDTCTITPVALPYFSYPGIPNRCYNDGAIPLTLNKIVKAFWNKGASSSTDIHYYQKYKNPSWITGGPTGPFVYDYPKFISNAQIPLNGLRDTICYDFTDSNGCYNKECKFLKINPNPVTKIDSAAFTQCRYSENLNALIKLPFNRVAGIETFTCIQVPAGSGVNKDSVIKVNTGTNPYKYDFICGNPSDSLRRGRYILQFTYKDVITGCSDADTAALFLSASPYVKILNFPKQCINFKLLALDSFAYLFLPSATPVRSMNGHWRTVEYQGSRDMSNPSIASKINGSVDSGKYFKPGIGTGNFLLKYTDTASNCAMADSVQVTVNGLPIVTIEIQDTVCSNSAPVTLNNIVPSGNVGIWSGPGVSNRSFYPTTAPGLKQFEGPYKIKYTYTHPLTNCTSSDSETVIVQNAPDFAISALPIRGTQYDVEFKILNTKFIDTTVYKCYWDFGNSTSASNYTPGRIHYNDSGKYTVRVSAAHKGCGKIDSVEIELGYKLGNKAVRLNDASLNLYPNPASDGFFLNSDFSGSAQIVDQSGKRIMEFKVQSDTPVFIPVSEWQAGVYTLVLESDGYLFVKSFNVLH